MLGAYMGSRLIATWVAGASLFGAGAIASALDAGLYEISFDPAKTQIKWELDGTVHNTHGTFRLKQGHVSLDPRTGAASGEVLVDANSGESSDSVRDHRMQKDVLESLKYPEIRFIPQRVDGKLAPQGKSSLMISGLFEIHGARHAITVPAEVKVDGNQVLGTVHFEIPYVDWGMKDPSTFILRVDKTVKIELDASGQISQ
jgi:polyisoprenoid-binding protein YceI